MPRNLQHQSQRCVPEDASSCERRGASLPSEQIAASGGTRRAIGAAVPWAAARFALVLAAAAGILWLGYRDEVLAPVLALWRIEVAKAVLGLIHWAGMEATREATAIYHPGGFAYEISRGCTGFVPAALLGTAIAAYPAAGGTKLAGLVLGVPLLLGVNLARLVHLYYVGVQQPQWFDTAHKLVWEGLIIVAVIGVWLTWAAWADRGARRRARTDCGSRQRSGKLPPEADR